MDNIEGLICKGSQTLFIFYRRVGSMNNPAVFEGNKTRAILYCCSAKGDNLELQEQNDVLDYYLAECV